MKFQEKCEIRFKYFSFFLIETDEKIILKPLKFELILFLFTFKRLNDMYENVLIIYMELFQNRICMINRGESSVFEMSDIKKQTHFKTV